MRAFRLKTVDCSFHIVLILSVENVSTQKQALADSITKLGDNEQYLGLELDTTVAYVNLNVQHDFMFITRASFPHRLAA